MSKRILIVEDESSIADTIVYALQTDGFEPVWCSTAHQAREVFKHEQIDLIVLDIGLPDLNGFELFRELRQIKNIPVVFLTARADEVDKIAGLEMGADDYLTKPFSPRELTARVRAVLRRASGVVKAGAVSETSASSFPLQIDTDRKSISYFGRALQLSRYEYNILEIFVSHPGKVYSRERLMSLAWDDPLASLERTVDAHIKSLRTKLREIKPDIEPITTHRGSGYSLREDW